MKDIQLYDYQREMSERIEAAFRSCLSVMVQMSRHYQEMKERPSLIVIDEAHHAVAKTYKEVMDAYPEAKKLGLTATPCRLTKRGFTDLFDVLLQSWSAKKFIADGWLSLYVHQRGQRGLA